MRSIISRLRTQARSRSNGGIREARRAAAAALAALPDRHRIATILAYRHGLSCADIADVMSVSGDDVRRLLHESMHTLAATPGRSRIRRKQWR